MDGIIVINKPAGKTSHDIVYDVKKTLGARKVGHTGTLDPLATGVLPICINEATKIAQYLIKDKKEYRATMQLGIRTDTLDIDGNITDRSEPDVTRGDVERALDRQTGIIEQSPPMFSAVKYKGKALYKWARQGIAVKTESRTVEIQRIEIIDFALPYVTFEVSCSKGTYIRSICSEAGEILGCGACLAALERTRSGAFTSNMAVSLAGLNTEEKRNIIGRSTILLKDSLPDISSVIIDKSYADKIRDGYQPSVEAMRMYHIPFLAAGDMIKFVTDEEGLIALGKMICSSDELSSLESKIQAVKVLRVFNGR
jgi:tRNA pseudouridine55 synthase